MSGEPVHQEPARKEPASTPPTTPPATDEVSLRDLYLVLLRGLPAILGLALAAGALAFFYNSGQAPVFAAESTVLVTPPPIQIQGGDNLSFSPAYEVSFQTYDTLARSQLVLQNAVARLPGVNISPEQLLGLGSIRQLIGPQRPDQVVPLSVIHRVRNADPERASSLADAWAQSTLEAVRASLFASLSPVDATTTQEVARLQGNIEEVEARYRTFSAGDNGPQLEAQLTGLTRELTDGRAREAQLRRSVAAAEARVGVLEAQAGETAPTDTGTPANTPADDAPSPLPAATTRVLSAQRALRAVQTHPPQRAADALPTDAYGDFEGELNDFFASLSLSSEDAARLHDLATNLANAASDTLRRTLERQGEAQAAAREQEARAGLRGELLIYAAQLQQVQGAPPLEDTGGIVALLAEADLLAERVSLAGLEAELAALQTELLGYDDEASGIQQEIAALNQQRGRLNRELENALGSYNTVAELQSSVSYLTELAPTNARILSEASVPTTPVGPRRTFNTALATLLGALLGLLFVFLHAAVRQPHRPTPSASRKVSV